MLYYVRNEGDKASHIDKNLPYILEKVCYVHGNEQLVKSYKGKVTKFLHSKNENDPQGRLNCESRVLKLLEEGAVEIDYLHQPSSQKQKKGDLDALQPNLWGAEGRLFDVKQEIYRLPDRILYNLSMYYGLEGDSAWDTIDKLRDKKVIISEAATNLKNAVTFATTLRLKTYLHHKAQTEDMSIFTKPAETESELKAQAKQIFYLSEEDLGEQGGLFQYFYTALPLHEKLKYFCEQYQTLDNTSKQTFFQENKFYIDDHANKGFIHYRLAQYKKAQTNLEEALGNPGNQYNFQIRNTLGKIYNNFGNGDKSIEQFQYCLEMMKLIYKDQPHPDVATSLNNLGIAYNAKGQYDKAIEYYTESLEMMKLIYKDQPHPDVAASLNNLGSVYASKGQYDKAIESSTESLEIYKRIYKDQPHPDVAASLHNLGNVYYSKGQHDKAIEYYTESLKIYKRIYKDQPHPDVADSLNNLGVTYKAKGQYDKAIEYYTESLEMRKLIYKDQPHPDVAASLHNLGSVYDSKGQHDKAIEYYTESLKIYKRIYKDQPHPDVADSLNNLGVTYKAKGQYDKAIEYYTESLEIYKLIYKDQPNPDVADSLNNLGEVYRAKGEYKQAIYYASQALQMISIFQDHPYQESILKYLVQSTKLFAESYCLNTQQILNKIVFFLTKIRFYRL
ncbi:tetratricopeptide repeat protein [Candidatus Tisiphia endosymbiont of Xenochironomus xenolabis]|uniref:tetratricopeptide repeat protein n=1 Tax=Candidatus Tisiphia endosymbiont of Xenochironomus xenolabis TaxID=3139334 RepID=UPI0035C8F726